MSKKDVEQYYYTLNAQYHEFAEELKDFEDLCSQKLVSPEVVESAKKQFLVVKDNWERLNYIMYLLNKPVKKSKESWYKKQNKNKLVTSITSEQVIQENNKALEDFRQKTNI